MLWLPVLLLAEMLRPRLGYDVRRWSTGFPVGMYAACSFVSRHRRPGECSHQLRARMVWAALVVWGVVFAAMIRGAVRVVDGEQRPAPRDGF